MTRIYIILNPTSGRGAAALAQPQIEARLKALGADYALVQTRAMGHAVELAEQAALTGSWDVVAAAGGDGTLNEVLNGLARARIATGHAPSLGLIPVGRGNDFGFGIHAPMPVDDAVALLVENKHKPVDVLLVTGGDFPGGRYVGNGVGMGFDAVVGFEAAKLKGLTGLPSYLVAALKTIFLYFKAPNVRIEFDHEQIEQPALMVSIMNGRRMGGGFMMAPEGQIDDGLIDVCIANQVGKLAIFGLIPKFMQGSQAGDPAIRMLRTQAITITALSGSTLPAHADGETLCTAGQRLEVKILPSLLEVVSPQE